ncbi:MAG TPA: GNAT family N-acetyltransferase [Acidimicrobiales bacterium]
MTPVEKRSPLENGTGRTRSGATVVVAPLAVSEHDPLFALFAEVVASGEGYPQAPPLTRGMFETTWVTSVTLAVAARVDGVVVGAYYLKPNFPGRGAHIANAGYVVDRVHRRAGVGRLLVEDSLWRAPLLGFDAIQFNLVFAGNPARSLYEELGWREIGRLPDAVDGEDALIYWRRVG